MKYAAYTALYIAVFCLGIEVKEATLPRVTHVIEPDRNGHFALVITAREGGGIFDCGLVHWATPDDPSTYTGWICDPPARTLK
jgi:hypothetical protein